MRFRQAVKLHAGDEVQIKQSGEVVRVLETEVQRDPTWKPAVKIFAQASDGVCCHLYHVEVK